MVVADVDVAAFIEGATNVTAVKITDKNKNFFIISPLRVLLFSKLMRALAVCHSTFYMTHYVSQQLTFICV